jgi:hypothetical protein
MTHTYPGLLSFYNAHREPKRLVTIKDIDELVAELRKRANVRISSDESLVTVSEHSDKYGPQKKYCRSHYTKLSAAIPRDLAKEFSAACKTLGIGQISVIEPLLKETIAKAGKLVSG